MMYGSFASVYDALMAGVDYPAWAAFYQTLAKESGVSLKTCVDCACGTGSMTLSFHKLGLSVTGVDLSTEMLAIAGEKARRQGAFVPFICQDMRKFSLHRPVDAVFSACDGVNYLLQPKDVKAFFAASHAALKAGGGLFFDISSEYKLSRVLGNRCLGNDGREIAYLWQNHYDLSERILQMDLNFFRREADGRYTRFFETHRQKAHRPQEIAAWLGEAGFENIRIYGDQHLGEISTREERLHFAAVKPAQA